MKKLVLRTLTMLVALLMVVAFVGCAAQSDAPAGSDAPVESEDVPAEGEDTPAEGEDAPAEGLAGDLNGDGKITVSLLVKKLSSTFWTDLESGVKTACEDLGWEMRETLCPITADSNEEQIELLEQDLLDPPDVYVLCPADSQGITPAVEQINAAGIPIFNVNTRIADESLDVVSFVGVDCRQIAREVAEQMSSMMDYKGNIVILQGTTGSQTGIDYYEGGVEIFDTYPEITIMDSQVANYNRQEGLSCTQNLLQKYDNIDAIYACNLEMAMGATVACEEAGRTNILIGTINMSDEGAAALKAGKLGCIADDNPYNVGYTAVMSASEYFNGATFEGDIICPATMVVDGTDVATEYYTKYGLN